MVAITKLGKSQQTGMTYVFFLWFILIYGILLGSYIEITSTQSKRLKEQDFIYTAQLYIKALERYYKDHQALPKDIKLLLCDGQTYPCKRYLRQLYKDPLTHQSFIYIYDEQKQVIGVKTRAKGEVINARLRENYQVNNYWNLEFKIIIPHTIN
ncbi:MULTISPECIES: hypothetical protein [unclassified Acinetobacter]|uniref:hypothetical protein n=1 Tax=unclassified Acinetobacter TaxID=196816 RepID=UPI00244C1D23|nr:MULTISPECIES: hypothetical protein [unclassified Acinetobacter]MDH0032168.1 hypothetical protein [Acinetobacter sp. GD04021]MDH0886057.1 hypothetical protein [Acinetobacter sp. GD03873]MDH1082677.1 hypothetical protein [Acinetobacter sp. GD03983]MDH2189528.1 hypothetical protein [Acinetobacter sp. GD03645]MDH2203641.1 hypothetical protein [Acinetobacter sp. GD03647]